MGKNTLSRVRDMALNQIKKIDSLIQDGSNLEALDLILTLSNNSTLSFQERNQYKLLHCQTLYELDDYNLALKYSYDGFQNLSNSSELVEKVQFGCIHARSLKCLGKLSESRSFLDELEVLIKTSALNKKQYKLFFADICSIHSDIFWFQGELDKALLNVQKSLQIREVYGDQNSIAESLGKIGVVYCEQGDLSSGLIYLEEALTIYTETNNQKALAKILNNIAWIHKLLGNLDVALKYLKDAQLLLRKIGIKKDLHDILANIGIIYRQKGDLDTSLYYLNKSLSLVNEVGNPIILVDILYYKLLVMLDKKDFAAADSCFTKIKKIGASLNNPRIKIQYQLARALITRQNLRSRNIFIASTIFQKIIAHPVIRHEFTVIAMLNLSDLLLVELRTSDDVRIIDEINQIIEKLLKIAQMQKSYILWAEIYSLQAKLALIQWDFKRARHLYQNAQLLAENQGLKQFAIKISNEHDTLVEKQSMWEKMAEADVSVSKRVDMAQIESQMERMLRDGIVNNSKIEPETPLLLNIMSENGPNIFTYKFLKDWQYDDQLFGALLSAFQSFSGEFFSESFDRAKFGKYNILLKHEDPIIICYVFQGKSFLAKQKMRQFTKFLRKNKSAWECLYFSAQNGTVINPGRCLSLELLISQVFKDQNHS
ncbi:tetratricopeptide repeat protein [Candidatus Lokiarchaeum ossiferum]|uniref:tetratricopeptide repeat protein n=1 Tax=Candidatus Lokiarchaeum ossiferum TaxID=2951803 RepID=UPI00352F3279